MIFWKICAIIIKNILCWMTWRKFSFKGAKRDGRKVDVKILSSKNEFVYEHREKNCRICIGKL